MKSKVFFAHFSLLMLRDPQLDPGSFLPNQVTKIAADNG